MRIGEKLLDRQRLLKTVEKIVELRGSGLSQQEVADRVGIDRAFVSRLESLGEVRKGARIALVGFPVGNKEELREVAREEGIDFVFLLTDEERWAYLRERSGQEVFNEVMKIITGLKTYDAIIFIGSDMRCGLVESILGERVISVIIGTSPIKGDRHVDPATIREIVHNITET